MSDIHQQLGRVEGKLDGLHKVVEGIDRRTIGMDDRLRVVERKAAVHSTVISTVVSATVSAIVASLKSLTGSGS